MKPKYNIGAKVYWASQGSSQCWATCSDCGGTGRIRLIMHDDTEHQIECGGCSAGYNPPSGKVSYYQFQAKPEVGHISGMKISSEGIEYNVSHAELGNSYYVVQEKDICETKEEAQLRAVEKVKIHNAEEIAKLDKKEKDTKSWAWNLSYHRKRIRDAEKDIIHHTAKLNAANLKEIKGV